MRILIIIFAVSSFSFPGIIYVGKDLKSSIDVTNVDKLQKGGVYLGYYHLLSKEFLDCKRLSLGIGTSISITSIAEKKNNQLTEDLAIDLFSLYLFPSYSLNDNLGLWTTIGYNLFDSEDFKSSGGMQYGVGFYYNISNKIGIGFGKSINYAKLKYNYQHFDYYNETLGEIERTSELKLKRTIVYLAFNL